MGDFLSKEENSTKPTSQASHKEVGVLPKAVTLAEVDLGDLKLDVHDDSKEIAEYCLPLLVLDFCGQTSADCGEQDKGTTKKVLNLGLYLSLLDKFLRQFDNIEHFTGEEEEYHCLLRLVAMKRLRSGEETVDQCHTRLIKDSKRFVQIYKKRNVESEKLEHKTYWATRQQLLSGKVIGDWADKENGPLDPIFGVLLNPTTGRVGAGDSGWFHDCLYDDRGDMAYHSAVHDAFGYLKNFHATGPGYDYMKGSFFSTDNPLAGQISGIKFWRNALEQITVTKKVLKYWQY